MIAEFYEDAEIFITGGSGVVGKAAIEKLFRSCNVKKIYILLRVKRGAKAEDRLQDIKNSRIFKLLKELKPNELDKLFAIPGDTGFPGLGISAEHKEMLKNVSVFFHSAATTRFNEPLKTALRLNVQSTLEALKLAETFQQLKIFIHVSTFFSNPYAKFIEHKVYPAKFDWRTALKMLEDDKIDPILNTITDKVIQGFPNTYLFTKHLAEQVVNEYRCKLPVGIYRPSIVVGSVFEPERGYTETQSGIMGLILVWGAGLIQVLPGRKDIQMDVTPLDFCTNVFLISAARTAQLPREKFIEETPVTIFSSVGYINYTLGKTMELIQRGIEKYPYEKSIWLPSITMSTCPVVFWFLTIFLQLLPSLLVDGLLRLFGKKPFMMQIQRKIFLTVKVLSFFINNEYGSGGITNLDELIALAKGTAFSIDEIKICTSVEREAEVTTAAIPYGCRKFLMNEDDSTLERCRKIQLCKKIAYNGLRGYVIYVVGKAALRICMTYLGY